MPTALTSHWLLAAPEGKGITLGEAAPSGENNSQKGES